MANHAVFGIYGGRASVEHAVAELRANGFRAEDISLLWPQNVGTKELAHERSSKAPEGAAAGAASGAAVGGVLGWLMGIGALTIPGLGVFLAAGPLMALLGGVGVGATVGGLTGSLIGLGIPEYEAKRYEGMVKSGGILLSVHADDASWSRKAKTILDETGADQVSSVGESRGDYANSERPVRRPGV